MSGEPQETEAAYDRWRFELAVSADTAAAVNQARAGLLAGLDSTGATRCAGGSKVYRGQLSPGCQACVDGTWSCLFVNRLCTASCFFCPQDRSRQADGRPEAEGIPFEDPDAYVDYLQRFGFRGVGFSGGEPLLVLDRLLAFLRRIKERSGAAIYVWVYTNGDLVTEDGLKALRDAGLDELRLNLAARAYDPTPVALACRLLENVAVEIPAIPEDLAAARQVWTELSRLGVRYLNLHQLHLTKHNHRRVGARGYTVTPCLEHHPVVAESELDSLRLLQQAASGPGIPSGHYCSTTYKHRYQSRARRRRAALAARSGPEAVSEAGYLVRLSASGTPELLGATIAAFAAAALPSRPWELSDDGSELAFHPDLLDRVDPRRKDLRLRFFEAELVPDGGGSGDRPAGMREFRHGHGPRTTLRRRPVAVSEGLDAAAVRALWCGRPRARLEADASSIRHLRELVFPDEGFPEVLDTSRYWSEMRDRALRYQGWRQSVSAAAAGGGG